MYLECVAKSNVRNSFVNYPIIVAQGDKEDTEITKYSSLLDQLEKLGMQINNDIPMDNNSLFSALSDLLYGQTSRAPELRI